MPLAISVIMVQQMTPTDKMNMMHPASISRALFAIKLSTAIRTPPTIPNAPIIANKGVATFSRSIGVITA